MARSWPICYGRPLCAITASLEASSPVPSIDRIKQRKREIISRYSTPDNLKGLTQLLTTVLPIAGLWWVTVRTASVSVWLTVLVVPLLALFTLRAFALMHDCGHFSLFRSRFFNRLGGFVFGVLAGRPQFVWAQNHNFHHAHNGDWSKYRGPYTTLSVEEYAALSESGQRMYRRKCSMLTAPLAGFIYLVFNPRYTWLKGTVQWVIHVVRSKLREPGIAWRVHVASFKPRYWKNASEYRHMTWNNIALLTIWAVMSWVCGAGLFFAVYVASVSLAGGGGILLFTVQHNFEHSYASETHDWCYDRGAIEGTSHLILPAWLNWFTVDIAYHHIHHLSVAIPNYRLAACHREYADLMGAVRRVTLAEVPSALQCILWDRLGRRIISVAEYQHQH